MATTTTDLPRKRKLTVTDYYCLAETGGLREGDRVELIEGEIIDMAPIGSPHASKVGYLTQRLQRAVGNRALVWVQMPVRLETHSEPQPDLMLLKPRADFYESGHPAAPDVFLLVEVAHASLRFDREIKLPLYARHGITEVWLVDVESRRLTTYRQPKGDRYRTVVDLAPLDGASIEALPGILVDLVDLF